MYETRYRYGFNGQEKDNEIAGIGNSMTAQYWQYDSRLGRRWNTDPVVKPWESPYATFSSNPISFSDPSGDNSKVTVTQGENGENNKVNVQLTIYYNKKDPKMKDLVDRLEGNGSHPDATPKDRNRWTKQTPTIEYGGEKWDITYTTTYVGLESDDAVREAVAADPDGFSNGYLYAPNYTRGAAEVRGRFAYWKQTIEATDGEHENGHLMGLPHASAMKQSPYYRTTHHDAGIGQTGLGESGNEQTGEIKAGIMSYAVKTAIQSYEINRTVMGAIQMAHKSNFPQKQMIYKVSSEGTQLGRTTQVSPAPATKKRSWLSRIFGKRK